MKNKKKMQALVNHIITNELIYPVFQPIVCLSSADIFGYEALSRVSDYTQDINIEHLFDLADEFAYSWELEKLCRQKSIKAAADLKLKEKLFINVDPNIIYHDDFKKGFTQKRLAKYGFDPHQIIFEITERTVVSNVHTFKKTIAHYQNQQYNIAIDDVGSGYSGLTLICDTNPDYLKIDMNLVRDIDSNTIKHSLVASLIFLAANLDIKIIAEGIETEAELKTLINMGVDYGQGYFIGKPQQSFDTITTEVQNKIHTQLSHRKPQSLWRRILL